MAGGNETLAKKYVEFAQKGMGEVVTMTRKLGEEMTRAKERATVLQKSIASGTYQKQANQLAAINRQYAAMKQSGRLQDLIAEHGKFGGTLVNLQERMAGVNRAAAAGFGILTATTMGWVTAGLQGTVEAYRLQQGFTYLSREVAGVFKPTIDSATDGLYSAVNWFRGLDESQQTTIRTTVLWAGGLMGGVLVLNMTVKAIAALRAGLIATGVAMKGMGQGFMGVAGGMKGLLALGAVGAVAYAANEATRGPGAGPEDAGVVEKFGSTIASGAMSLWDSTFGRITKTSAEVEKGNRRRFLENRERWKQLNEPEKAELEKTRKEEAKKKNAVSLNQTGFEAIGSGWDRMASEVLKMADPQVVAMNRLTTATDLLREQMARKGIEMPSGKGRDF